MSVQYIADTEYDMPIVGKRVKDKAWTSVRRGKLFKMAYAKLQCEFDAEDAVNNAFERALRYNHTFNGKLPFGVWFNTILKNCIRDVKISNRHQGMGMVDEDDKVEEVGPELIDEYARIAAMIFVEKNIKNLNAKEQDLVNLVLKHGHTLTTAASIIGVTPQYAHKAMKKLQEMSK